MKRDAPIDVSDEVNRNEKIGGLSANEVEFEGKSLSCERPKTQRQKRAKIMLLFGMIFCVSIVVGIVVSLFMGSKDGVMSSGGIWLGLGIGAAVGVVVAVLPCLVILLTMPRK